MFWQLLALLLASPSTPPQPAPPAARCPDSATHCASLRVFLTATSESPSSSDSDRRFLDRQVTEANRLLGLAGLGFEVASTTLIAAPPETTTRADRDGLGDLAQPTSQIDLFIVSRLADVDARTPTEIRGVHWRQRKDRERRYIILSRISGDFVLAHELGHYFGLPHSDHDISIMNKRPRATPPEARSFATAELSALRRNARRTFDSGALVDRRTTSND
jgi:hypothetical protein